MSPLELESSFWLNRLSKIPNQIELILEHAQRKTYDREHNHQEANDHFFSEQKDTIILINVRFRKIVHLIHSDFESDE